MCFSGLFFYVQVRWDWGDSLLLWGHYIKLLIGSKARPRPVSLCFSVYCKRNMHMHYTRIYEQKHMCTLHTCAQTWTGKHVYTHANIDTHTNTQTNTHSHWWYKQLKRQGWIIASWKTVLHRLWGAFWREYNILKGLQTLTWLHDSLLSKELDGEMDGVKDGERWQPAEEGVGDRLKHSRGYERGQKFPAICAVMCV